jgi:hypothetical protein
VIPGVRRDGAQGERYREAAVFVRPVRVAPMPAWKARAIRMRYALATGTFITLWAPGSDDASPSAR